MSYEKNYILKNLEVKDIENHQHLRGFESLSLVSEATKENFNRIWELATRNIDRFSRDFFPANPNMLIIDIDACTTFSIRDAHIIHHNPYLLLEGALLIAAIFEIPTIFFVIRGEYPKIFGTLNSALKEFRKAVQMQYREIIDNRSIEIISGSSRIFLNHNILTSLCAGHNPSPMKIITSGKLADIKIASESFRSVILDVETAARLPGLMRAGISENLKEFKKILLVTITGEANSPGVYEIAAGLEFSELLSRKARGLNDNKRLKAVKMGGALSPVIPAGEAMKINLDLENFENISSDFATPTIILISDETSIKEMLIDALNYFVTTACGYCIYGRESLRIFNKELVKIMEGTLANWENLERIADGLKDNGYCDFPDPIPMLIKSCIENFPSEFE